MTVEGLLGQTVVTVGAYHAATGIYIQGKLHTHLGILGENARGQTVAGMIGNFNGLVQGIKADHREYRSEDLLIGGNIGVYGYIGQYRGLYKAALTVTAANSASAVFVSVNSLIKARFPA